MLVDVDFNDCCVPLTGEALHLMQDSALGPARTAPVSVKVDQDNSRRVFDKLMEVVFWAKCD